MTIQLTDIFKTEEGELVMLQAIHHTPTYVFKKVRTGELWVVAQDSHAASKLKKLVEEKG